LAIGLVSCLTDSFVITENLYLRVNICAENPAHDNLQNVFGRDAIRLQSKNKTTL